MASIFQQGDHEDWLSWASIQHPDPNLLGTTCNCCHNRRSLYLSEFRGDFALIPLCFCWVCWEIMTGKREEYAPEVTGYLPIRPIQRPQYYAKQVVMSGQRGFRARLELVIGSSKYFTAPKEVIGMIYLMYRAIKQEALFYSLGEVEYIRMALGLEQGSTNPQVFYNLRYSMYWRRYQPVTNQGTVVHQDMLNQRTFDCSLTAWGEDPRFPLNHPANDEAYRRYQHHLAQIQATEDQMPPLEIDDEIFNWDSTTSEDEEL